MIPTRFSQRARNLEYATERAGYAPSLAFRAMSRKDMAVHSMLNVKEAVAAGALVRMKTDKRCGAESLPTNFGFGRFTQYISSTASPSTGSTDDEMFDSSSPSSPVSPSTSKDTPGKKVPGASSPSILFGCSSYSASQQCPSEGGADRKRSRVEESAAAAAGASSQKRSRHDDGFTTHEALMAWVAFLGAGSSSTTSSSGKSSLRLAPFTAKAAKAVEGKAPAGMKIALARNGSGGSSTSSGSNSGSTSGSSSGSTSGSGSGGGSGGGGGGGGSSSSGKRRRVVWDAGDEEEEDDDAETQPASKQSRK